jgi:hypothetical protein
VAEPKHSSGSPLWGVSAEFDSADAMCAALKSLRNRGLGRLDAYSPTPVAGAAELAGLTSRSLYPVALAAAALGGLAMFGLCTYGTIWGYRFDIGGRPLFSWPSYIVPTVSFGALIGSLASVGLLLAASRLPRLNHPAFNIPGFTRATEGRFFVAVEALDDGFDAGRVELALASLVSPPLGIHRVPR